MRSSSDGADAAHPATISSGAASETTSVVPVAANIWPARVEPDRDMWNTNPEGSIASSIPAARARSASGVTRGKSWRSGACRHRSTVCSKNGSSNPIPSE
jgi:hypothetical protein